MTGGPVAAKDASGFRFRATRLIGRGVAWSRDHRSLIWIVAIGLLVRYALAIYSAEGDTVTFAAAAASMAYGQQPYTYLVNYPPGWVFLLGLLGRTYSALFSAGTIVYVPSGLLTLSTPQPPWFEPTYFLSVGFNLLLKSVLFVFDLLTGVLAYVMIKERTHSQRMATYGLVFWFLNPFVISVSAIHGTYDSIPAFLVLLAYYFALKNDHLFSGISLGLGTVMKVFPIVLFPVFLFLFWDFTRPAWRAFLRALGMFSAGVGFVLALLFWPPGMLSQWFTAFFVSGNRGNQAFGGFNQWALLSLPGTNPVLDFLTKNATEVIVGSVVVLAFSFLLIARRTASSPPRSGSESTVYWDGTFLLAVCLVYLIVPVFQSQYILWVLPWVVLVLMVHGRFERWTAMAYSVISIAATLFYLESVESPVGLFQPLAFNTGLLSFGTLQSSLYYWSTFSTGLQPLFEIPVAAMLVVVAWIGFRLSGPTRRLA